MFDQCWLYILGLLEVTQLNWVYLVLLTNGTWAPDSSTVPESDTDISATIPVSDCSGKAEAVSFTK